MAFLIRTILPAKGNPEMEKPHLTFWFDFASTYSYLSAMRIGDMARDRGVAVT